MPLTFPPSGGNGHKSHTIYPLLVIPLLAIVLIAGTLAFYLNNQAHAAKSDTLVPLPDSVPAVAAKSKLLGPTDPHQTISLSFGLRLRNAAALDSYIADMNRPKSLNYHRHLTVNQIIGAFSPSQASHDAVLQYLQISGFTITHTYKHRMGIVFRGTIRQAEQIFHVSINNYTAPHGESFYSNATNPLLPSSLVGYVQSITGLNNVTRYHHAPIHLHSTQGTASKVKRMDAQTAPTSAGVSCPSSNSYAFLPNQIASAYDISGMHNFGFHGEGQTVALFELSQFNSGDINAYRSCFDTGSPTTVQLINVNGGPPAPNPNGDGGPAEVELDAELVLSAAPRLGTLKIYDAANDPTDAQAEWMQIVQDAPPAVSTSWGSCEANMSFSVAQSEKNLFAMAAAQGQSIFAASADSGSSGCLFDSTSSSVLSADDPASQPYVTGVGGTSLYLNSNNTYNHETVWNDQLQNSSNPQGGASGGGISIFWPAPSWQSAPGVNNSYTTGAPCSAPSGSFCREVPDVALSADPFTPITGAKGYLIYCTEVVSGCTSQNGAPWLDFGGTSCAAPVWAAMMALTNEESVKQGGFNIGFVNPLLYQLASTKYSGDFHDVTSGNNDWDALQSGRYPATPVYDMATGLGSPEVLHLATDLVALVKQNNGSRLARANATWYFAEGSVGGGFQEYITLQNPDPAQTANVSITYLLQGQNPPTVTVAKSVSASTRLTVDVDKDLHTSPAGVHISVAAIVKVTSGPPIVAERPMYFNFGGIIQSGTNVIGATSPGKSYYFAEGNSTQNGTANYSTFVTMLNPNNTAANVTITYSTGSCGESGQSSCPTEQVQIAPMQRGTANPGDSTVVPQPVHQKVAIRVSSDQNIVVERPMYVKDNIPNAGGSTTGAASQVGATAPGTDWLFAEGYTGTNFQEYFELANFDPANTANATVKLEFPDGTTQTFAVPVPAAGTAEFDVNAHTHGSVSAEITSDKAIVADRLMFFHFGSGHFSGVTDVVGAAAAKNVYAFAEGYTGGAFSEFLTLQNPTGTNETVAVTLFTGNSLVLQEQVIVVAHSRKTLSINAVLNPIASGAVSMTVQAMGAGAVIVAERPMYFGYASDNGGTDVIGYTGG